MSTSIFFWSPDAPDHRVTIGAVSRPRRASNANRVTFIPSSEPIGAQLKNSNLKNSNIQPPTRNISNRNLNIPGNNSNRNKPTINTSIT